MEIENSFRIDVPVAEAWRVLLDLERIAPCLPGAQLQAVAGDAYRGIVNVTVGPISAQYEGTARLESADEATHTAVLAATGRDTNGQGNASAAVKVVLLADGDGTRVDLVTDLSITGKVGQFGHDMIGDLARELVAQFAENLERDVLPADTVDLVDLTAGDAPEVEASETGEAEDEEADELVAEAVAAGAQPAASPSGNGAAMRKPDTPETDPVDLVEVSGSPLARRLAPLAGTVAIVLFVRWLLRRRQA